MNARSRPVVRSLLVTLIGVWLLPLWAYAASIEVQLPAGLREGPQDGRLLLILAPADQAPDQEPRFLVNWDIDAIPFFGLDVEGWKPGTSRTIDDGAFGFPVRALSNLPPGDYRVQAFLNRYETFRLADGRVLKLPPDRGKGSNGEKSPATCIRSPPCYAGAAL